jgi:hypothetical protein
MPPHSSNSQELIERIAENRRNLPAPAGPENEALREQIAADTLRLAALQDQED